jgi:guanylate kinase
MKTYKLIVLGPQCAGKSTLVRYLREHFAELPVVEEEEMFMELNGGKYPDDHEFKEKIMRPKLNEKLRQMESSIFLSSYCDRELLIELKSKGFKVVQLQLEMDEFYERNERRMKEEEYDDARTWAKVIFGYHQDIKNEGLVDREIDATLGTE